MQRSQGISPVLVQVIQALVIMILLALDTPALARLRARKWREVAAPRPHPARRSGDPRCLRFSALDDCDGDADPARRAG